MEFGALLHEAKKNSENAKSSQGKFYSTKFSAPKKESKEKKLSDNIKKFLEKKEQEEREKNRLEREKRDALLAMRDDKAKNKIRKMLKTIKSANKSVLEDAIDTENTAITIQGPDQPDEDDYGYVSNTAAAFYDKYMEKVKSQPEEPKFTPSRPQGRFDLSGTKDRVKAAIVREKEEKISGAGKIRQSKNLSSEPKSKTTYSLPSATVYNSETERTREADEKRKRDEEENHKKKPKKPPPPSIDFAQLLKIAEKKQHEPIEVVVEPKNLPERLLTSKEKKDLEKRKFFEDRERSKKEAAISNARGKTVQHGRIPKAVSSSEKNKMPPPPPPSPANTKPKPLSATKTSSSVNCVSSKDKKIETITSKSKPAIDSGNRSSFSKASTGGSGVTAQSQTQLKQSSPNVTKPSIASTLSKTSTNRALSTLQSRPGVNQKPSTGPTTELSPKHLTMTKRGQQKSPSMVSGRDTTKTRQFPPPDVRRSSQLPSSSKKSHQPVKRRIIEDDDDSEYDSELDDFIDDGHDDQNNYSSMIKEIFNYDRNRYRHIDEEDDTAMESNFAQISKEEYVSKKIGLMEDLEDMRKEAEDKKRKTIMKKRRIK